MIKNKKTCSKCKKEITETYWFYEISKFKHFYEYNDQELYHVIICENCIKSFLPNFLDLIKQNIV